MLPTRGVWLPALPSWHCHDRREENKHLYLHPEGGKETNIHSLELTWKWKMAPWKTIILYNQGIVDFHVNSREGNYNGNHTREAPPQLQALEAPARHTSPGSRLSVESSPVERRLSNGGPGGGASGTARVVQRRSWNRNGFKSWVCKLEDAKRPSSDQLLRR